jgi:hypothetical protein
VCLQGRSDLVGRLERLIDGPFPRDVVHHGASIPHSRLRLLIRVPALALAGTAQHLVQDPVGLDYSI